MTRRDDQSVLSPMAIGGAGEDRTQHLRARRRRPAVRDADNLLIVPYCSPCAQGMTEAPPWRKFEEFPD